MGIAGENYLVKCACIGGFLLEKPTCDVGKTDLTLRREHASIVRRCSGVYNLIFLLHLPILFANILLSPYTTHLSPKSEADPAVVLAPAGRVLIRVGPQQVTQQPLVRHVRRPHDPPDLLHRLQVGREAAMAAEYLLVHWKITVYWLLSILLLIFK